jgi:hypothetical protein
MPMLVILIFLKIVFDLFLHRKSHNKAQKKADRKTGARATIQ